MCQNASWCLIYPVGSTTSCSIIYCLWLSVFDYLIYCLWLSVLFLYYCCLWVLLSMNFQHAKMLMSFCWHSGYLYCKIISIIFVMIKYILSSFCSNDIDNSTPIYQKAVYALVKDVKTNVSFFFNFLLFRILNHWLGPAIRRWWQ